MKKVYSWDEISRYMLSGLCAKGECDPNTTYLMGIQVRGNSVDDIEFTVEEADADEPVKKYDEFGDEIEDINLDD